MFASALHCLCVWWISAETCLECAVRSSLRNVRSDTGGGGGREKERVNKSGMLAGVQRGRTCTAEGRKGGGGGGGGWRDTVKDNGIPSRCWISKKRHLRRREVWGCGKGVCRMACKKKDCCDCNGRLKMVVVVVVVAVSCLCVGWGGGVCKKRKGERWGVGVRVGRVLCVVHIRWVFCCLGFLFIILPLFSLLSRSLLPLSLSSLTHTLTLSKPIVPRFLCERSVSLHRRQ